MIWHRKIASQTPASQHCLRVIAQAAEQESLPMWGLTAVFLNKQKQMSETKKKR